jgi:hypothetical protein
MWGGSVAGAALGRRTEPSGLSSYPTRFRHERPYCWSVIGSMHTPGFSGVICCPRGSHLYYPRCVWSEDLGYVLCALWSFFLIDYLLCVWLVSTVLTLGNRAYEELKNIGKYLD